MSRRGGRYKHLQQIPIQSFEHVSPLLLIGADHPHLVTPIAPVNIGPPGGPAAMKTRLGYVLQGPTRVVEQLLAHQQCLFTSAPRCGKAMASGHNAGEQDCSYGGEKEVKHPHCGEMTCPSFRLKWRPLCHCYKSLRDNYPETQPRQLPTTKRFRSSWTQDLW